MKVIAITAEYNPLHTGHAWQLTEVRRASGADAVIVLMSGDYVQRGEPALFDKYTRAKAALCSGADLVLELPVSVATGSAQRFAEGAVEIAKSLGAVSELWFGSECSNIDPLLALAEILADEPEEFCRLLREQMRAGAPYPAAREAALAASLPTQAHEGSFGNDAEADLLHIPAPDLLHDLLSRPNNILGLEYCIALKKKHSAIMPHTHARIPLAADTPRDKEEILFSSASELRAALLSLERDSETLHSALVCFPPSARELFAERIEAGALLAPDDFSAELQYQLLREDEESLAGYADVSADLARQIIRHMHEYTGFSAFTDLLHTKNRTRSSVSRALLHILLGITPSDLAAALHPSFARILAMGDCDALLSEIKQRGRLKLISNPVSEFEGAYERDLFASNLYESVLSRKIGEPFVHDFSRKLIKQ